MFIKINKNSSGKNYVRIMESVRQGTKVLQKTIKSFGHCEQKTLPDTLKQAEKLMILLCNNKQPALPGMAHIIYGKKIKYDPIEQNKKIKNKKKSKTTSMLFTEHLQEVDRVHCGIKKVCETVYKQLKFDTIIKGTKKDKQWNEILKSCVLSRVAEPQSKRKTCQTLAEDYQDNIPLEKMYRMMDHLHPHISKMKALVAQNTLSLFNQQIDVLFFDVTTLYFESTEEDDIRQFGFSKDGKFKEVQVVLALITNSEGHPLHYQLYKGKTSETQTLIETLEELKKKFQVGQAFLIADRAMFVEKNLQYMEQKGIQYVVSAKLKALPKSKKEEILKQDFRVSPHTLNPIKTFEYKKRRLIVNYCEKRAKKDKKDRQRLIDRLMKKVKNQQLPIKSLIPNYGTKKYIKIEKTKACLDENKIQQDSLYDGLYGIITNIEDQSAEHLFARHRRLWKIEEAFRVCKHTLKMRPIYHWKKKRIQAHIAICWLAYALSYTMKHTMEQRGLNLSLQTMKEVLKKDQYSVIEDQKTNTIYQIPSKNTEQISAIYKAFGLKRNTKIIPYL